MSNSDWLRDSLRSGRARFKEEEKKEKKWKVGLPWPSGKKRRC